jgi:hypothetical protein
VIYTVQYSSIDMYRCIYIYIYEGSHTVLYCTVLYCIIDDNSGAAHVKGSRVSFQPSRALQLLSWQLAAELVGQGERSVAACFLALASDGFSAETLLCCVVLCCDVI